VNQRQFSFVDSFILHRRHMQTASTHDSINSTLKEQKGSKHCL